VNARAIQLRDIAVDLIELEIRELLHKTGHPGDEIPMIRGSALKAQKSPSKNLTAPEYECIRELLQNVETSLPGQ